MPTSTLTPSSTQTKSDSLSSSDFFEILRFASETNFRLLKTSQLAAALKEAQGHDKSNSSVARYRDIAYVLYDRRVVTQETFDAGKTIHVTVHLAVHLLQRTQKSSSRPPNLCCR